MFCLYLGVLLNGNKEAAFSVLQALNNFSARLDVCIYATRVLIPEGPEKDGINLLFNKVRRLAQTRNKYVHGIPIGDKEPEILNFRMKANNPVERSPFRPSEIRAHNALVEEITLRLELAISDNPQLWAPQPDFVLNEHVSYGYSPCPHHARASSRGDS